MILLEPSWNGSSKPPIRVRTRGVSSSTTALAGRRATRLGTTAVAIPPTTASKLCRRDNSGENALAVGWLRGAMGGCAPSPLKNSTNALARRSTLAAGASASAHAQPFRSRNCSQTGLRLCNRDCQRAVRGGKRKWEDVSAWARVIGASAELARLDSLDAGPWRGPTARLRG